MNVQFAYQSYELYVLEVNPAGVAHGAVRQQGDRRAARQARHPRHPRGDARRARPAAAPRAATT